MNRLGSQSHQKFGTKTRDHITTPVLSNFYRDAMITLSEDQLTATGYKGWTTVLLSHGATSGAWYFEVTLGEEPSSLPSPGQKGKPLTSSVPLSFFGQSFPLPTPSPHLRIGWGSRYSRYDAPLGVDQFGTSIRDTNGDIMFDGVSIPYAKTCLGNGSVVGCGILLEPCDTPLPDPRLKPELHPFLKEGLLCDPRFPPQTHVHSGAKIQCIVNGQVLNPLSLKLRFAMYHPGISLYMGARARVHLGPDFYYTPPQLDILTQERVGVTHYSAAYLLNNPEF